MICILILTLIFPEILFCLKIYPQSTSNKLSSVNSKSLGISNFHIVAEENEKFLKSKFPKLFTRQIKTHKIDAQMQLVNLQLQQLRNQNEFNLIQNEKVSSFLRLQQIENEQERQFDKEKFVRFKQEFVKQYGIQQEQFRFSILRNNFKFIEIHNSKNLSYQTGLNKFSDLTQKQFTSIYLTKLKNNKKPLIMKPKQNNFSLIKVTEITQFDLIQTLDYRKIIKFHPVQYQGNCQACFVFACIGAIEANIALSKLYKNQYYQVPKLSEQQVVDCCISRRNQFCGGCSKGGIEQTLEYISDYGLTQNQIYPYNERKSNCDMEKASRSIYYLNKQDPYETFIGVDQTISALIKYGPLIALVYPKIQKWSGYRQFKTGVFRDCESTEDINQDFHAVVIVGVDVENQAWIIRNSWGDSWGEQGYIRIDLKNNCNLTDWVYHPKVY